MLIYYKYVHVPRPKDEMIQQRALCTELNLRGRILIAPEGINGTFEGSEESAQKYIDYMNKHPLFNGIRYKTTDGTGNAFKKLKVKVRNEIVTSELGDEDIDPNQISGEHLTAEELHEWFQSGKKFKIVDMRNDYEHAAGHFDGGHGFPHLRELRTNYRTFLHRRWWLSRGHEAIGRKGGTRFGVRACGRLHVDDHHFNRQ